MKKPIPFSIIGIFVVLALGILVSGILFFGSGKVFTRSQSYVMFFDQSVNGLKLGSTVKFRGVEIGSVEQITLGGSKNSSPQIAVVVKVFKSSLGSEFQNQHDFYDTEVVDKLIDQGLRAQLLSQSVLSGDLYLSLDFFPEQEAHYILEGESSWVEIPTIKSGLMEEFTANSAELGNTLKTTLQQLETVLLEFNDKLGPLTEESILTMQETRKMMKTASDLFNPESPLGYQAPKTLEEFERAARAVRHLAESLDRNPSSLIFGKSGVEVVEAE